jgi:hypothetical protein
MTSVKIVGDPDLVCSNLAVIITAGNNILSITKTKSNSAYIVTYEPSGPVVNDFILMEDGSFLLLESGDKFILQ